MRISWTDRVLPGIALVLSATACGGDAPTDVEVEVPGPAEVATLSLGLTELDLFVGGSDVLRATARDAGGTTVTPTLTWASSDSAVARVSPVGFVTGWSHGEATITVSTGGLSAEASVAVTGLGDPLVGALNVDYYITNYFDQSLGPAVGDYACGPKSYDGHRGVDIVLPDFRKMDAGVDVVASAAGTVIEAHDGEFDRNKSWGNNTWNVVRLDHGGQLESVYGHLRSGSVAVTVGEVVAEGDKLGQVGSSGRSDMPHLHFELRQGAGAVDPYGGACSWTREYFREPAPYQDEFHLIAAGVTDQVLNLDRVKDGLLPVDTVGPGDARVTGWVHLHNKAANAQVVFDLYRPDGTLHGSVDVTRPQFYSMSWWWGWWDRSALDAWPGRWTMEFRYRGALVATRSFELVGADGGASLAPGPARALGAGGGVSWGDRPPG